jgi:hypothetical protein
MVKCPKYFDQDLVNPASAGENLARYIIRASFSQERMKYFPEDSKVVYRSKDGKEKKIFDALEWLVPPPAGFSCAKQGRIPPRRE